jgi:biopolymer transport protein TolR
MVGRKSPSPVRRSRRLPEPDMNVTPLVDVTLVLLIIFMVLAPAINEGEQVELPKVQAVDERPRDLNPVEITVAGDVVVLDKERIDPGQLEGRLRDLHRADPERQVMLKTDSTVPYEKVRAHFALLRDVGFRGVQLKVLQRADEEGS